MKLTAKKREQILGALRVGADMGMAARAVSVSRTALYKLMDRDQAFRDEVNEARNFADETIVKSLYDQARNGNTTAIVFWLKNRKRREWRDRHEISDDRDAPVKGAILELVEGLREARNAERAMAQRKASKKPANRGALAANRCSSN